MGRAGGVRHLDQLEAQLARAMVSKSATLNPADAAQWRRDKAEFVLMRSRSKWIMRE